MTKGSISWNCYVFLVAAPEGQTQTCTHSLADLRMRNRRYQLWAKYSVSATCCGTPEGPLLWAAVQVYKELLKMQMYSLRGRLPEGGHITKGSICVHLRF